ncbi:Retrovirus-related Pol polyprotein from transposon RE2 [Cardamine amara subsp. amara]|uniref:Retrovirus-related Pol polyprotein from transposon RE2 n=1 Tax=Cardamine amara subsp. amara TaxID=228776 RepID=A0ABD1AR05_CARAN
MVLVEGEVLYAIQSNPAFHSRTKHFDRNHHYARERISLGTLVVKHVPSYQQIVDIFTKSLSNRALCSLRFKLGVDVLPTPSLRGSIKMKTLAQVESPQNDRPKGHQQELGCNEKKPKPILQKQQIQPILQRSSSPASNDKARGKCVSYRTEPIPLNNRFAPLETVVA